MGTEAKFEVIVGTGVMGISDWFESNEYLPDKLTSAYGLLEPWSVTPGDLEFVTLEDDLRFFEVGKSDPLVGQMVFGRCVISCNEYGPIGIERIEPERTTMEMLRHRAEELGFEEHLGDEIHLFRRLRRV